MHESRDHVRAAVPGVQAVGTRGDGTDSDELRTVAEVAGFRHTSELYSLFERMERRSDEEIEQLEEDFIRACAD